ncbi:Calcium-transporting ATPase protein [Dioscorea alata]|uniref:Calcium-transporting ATPase protein n=1 Tax=Dioscorea alata TaxID=55571 RepID=A0ACB7WPY6_DIOAL|nr:Calcium-transporting ATPase protein [Dioscorea alata]
MEMVNQLTMHLDSINSLLRGSSIGCDFDNCIFNEEDDTDKALMTIVAAYVGGNVFVPKIGGAIKVTGSSTEKFILSWDVKLGMKFNDTKPQFSIIHMWEAQKFIEKEPLK